MTSGRHSATATVPVHKRLIQRLLGRLGYCLMRTETRDRLAEELARVSREAQASAALAVAPRAPAPAVMATMTLQPGDPIYQPVFDCDGLRTDPAVIHNHDFMKDGAFTDAYWAGHEALGHDHRMFWRLHVALYFAKRGLALDGDFVECGVWRGFLSKAIATDLDWRRVDKRFFLFDTFDGLVTDQLTDAERANTQKVDHLNRHFRDCYGDVVRNFRDYPNVRIVRGPVPETLDAVGIERVAYLSIDMNNVNPELAAAEYFWDRLAPSAAIILDDYGFVSYEEQKRGFDRFAKARGTAVLALPTGQGIILKP